MNRRLLLLGAALAVAAALTANVALSLRSLDTLAEGYDNETRPAEVQRTLLGVLAAAQDAETGQRGYLLTGDAAYLRPYATARGEADSLLRRLDALVAWNPLQVDRMPGLRASLDAKFAELDETIALYRSEGADAALRLVQTDRGLGLMGDVRSRLDAMLREATRVREGYAVRADQALRDARRAAWISAVGLAALLGILAWSAWAAARRQEEQAAGLARINAALADANASQKTAMTSLSTALAEREAALARVRSMQAQLVQQEKLAGMGRLTAGVAHEIKNPLHFVSNFASLTTELADEAADAGRRGDTAEVSTLLDAIGQNAAKILQHSQRANDIVQSMLVHARGVTGVRRSVDVAEIVEAAVEQAVGTQDDGRVALAVHVAPELGPADMVAESVTRALRNLIDNALHAVRQRDGAGDPTYAPVVRISAEPGTDHDGAPSAVITVADNGAGIPDELFPRIFEPFFTTKGPGSGTGLGLSLAHDIAVGHGGTLLAERPAAGGAAFKLTLPLAATDPETGG